MGIDRIEKAMTAVSESVGIDFNGQWNRKEKRDCLELIKGIVAMANSGGGVIVIGLDDYGKPTGRSVAEILDVNPAKLADKISSYIGYQFGDFEIVNKSKNGAEIALIIIKASETPLMFDKDGNYQDASGKTQSVFKRGLIYVRHDSKSERCSSQEFYEMMLDARRKVLDDGSISGMIKDLNDRLELYSIIISDQAYLERRGMMQRETLDRVKQKRHLAGIGTRGPLEEYITAWEGTEIAQAESPTTFSTCPEDEVERRQKEEEERQKAKDARKARIQEAGKQLIRAALTEAKDLRRDRDKLMERQRLLHQ